MSSVNREGFEPKLQRIEDRRYRMKLVQRSQNDDLMAASNPQRLLLHCRNVLHGHLEVALMARLLGIPDNQRVLQVGCGSGVALPHLSKLCRPRVMTGIDIDATLLDEAKDRLSDKGVGADLVQADVREMPFPDGAFDLVIDFGVCYHVERPGDALREVARVLDTSGTFAYETPAAQTLAHPLADRTKRLPWDDAPSLTPRRRQLLCASRTKGESGRPRTLNTADEPYASTPLT